MGGQFMIGIFTGPRVYRKYSDTLSLSSSATAYDNFRTNILESGCDRIMENMEAFWPMVKYAAPISVIFGVRPTTLLKYGTRGILVYGAAYLGRGLGRALSKKYRRFLRIFLAATRENGGSSRESALRNLRRYDFEFEFWPIDYKWREADKDGRPIPERRNADRPEALVGEGILKMVLLNGLSFILARVLALRLAYPGLVFPASIWRKIFEDGRARMVEKLNGRRYKLRTRTGADIDSMFIDRRGNRLFENGNILVVTCEGNSGFYERGYTAAAPLRAEYSVFMWNHPGFACSTGRPWPREEAAAVDVVLQFALNRLGWSESEIVIYGWSIGGFTATWAGMNYGGVRALILDATFDDLVPMARDSVRGFFPPSFVERLVRRYLDLDIQSQLAKYNGPVTLIRRSRDEVMAILERAPDEPTLRKVNRLNYLLESLLRGRYPNIFSDQEVVAVVDDWLAATVIERVAIFDQYRVDTDQCRAALATSVEWRKRDGQPEEPIFPLPVGAGMTLEQKQAIALYLAASYLVEVDLDHGTSLLTEKFLVPRHPWE